MPVQVRCTILDAWGWYTGTTQREGMGREEGEGFRLGNTGIIGILNLKILIAKFELSGQTNAKNKNPSPQNQRLAWAQQPSVLEIGAAHLIIRFPRYYLGS